MILKKRFLFFLTLLCAGLLLMFVPIAGASINSGDTNYDSLMQTELDSLMNQVSGQFEATGSYLEKAEFFTVFTKGLAGQGAIKKSYDDALKAQELADKNNDNPELQEKARLAMDDLFLSVLYQIQLRKQLATTDQEITQALIDILEGKGEGFSVERGPFVLDALNSREGQPVIPPDEDDDDEDQSFGFHYYGKAYDLATDVDISNSTNGVLFFVEGPGDFLPEELDGDEDIIYSPYIAPLWVAYPDDGNYDSDSRWFENILATPEVTNNNDFYRYTWSEFHPDFRDSMFERFEFKLRTSIPPVSTSLYKNDWIALVYGNFENMEELPLDPEIYADLWPGHGEKDFHPGTSPVDNREWWWIDFSDGTGEHFDEFYTHSYPFNDPYNPDHYLGMYDYFDDNNFDLSDLFVVFIPDASSTFPNDPFPDEAIGNQYKVHTGNPFMIVDRSRHNFDEEYSSLDEAIVHIANNPDTLTIDPITDVNDFRPGYGGYGGYGGAWEHQERWPRSHDLDNNYPDSSTNGQYMYGLQTVGDYASIYHLYSSDEPRYGGWWSHNYKQYTPEYTQEKLDQDNFLAYVVQVEEDRVNEVLGEMSGHALWTGLKKGVRSYEAIRDRDAFFVQNADAQAGRVMKDIQGNWVRVQQYILRPALNTVKVLNVSLREAGSDLSGMSTIDFTTEFKEDIQEWRDLRSLPWGDYLTTRYDAGGNKYIRYYDQSYIEVAKMSVKFTNPGNESVSEVRHFADGEYYSPDYIIQNVTSETLTWQNAGTSDSRTNTFTFTQVDGGGYYTPEYQYISHFVGGPESGYYESDDRSYNEFDVFDDDELVAAADTKILDVNIYAVRDDYSNEFEDGGLPGDPEDGVDYEEIDGFADIWAVMGANEVVEGVQGDQIDGSIEIIMNKEGFFAKPVDTIFIPMSHMLWAWNNEA